MLDIETIAKMRRFYHVQGKGFKTIARELKVSKIRLKELSVKTLQRLSIEGRHLNKIFCTVWAEEKNVTIFSQTLRPHEHL